MRLLVLHASAVIWHDRENYRGRAEIVFFLTQNCLGAICRHRKSHRFPTPVLVLLKTFAHVT